VPAELEIIAEDQTPADDLPEESEAIATAEVPDDPDAPVARDVGGDEGSEQDPAKPDTPPGPASS
jgi:hypothetical protein